MGWLHRWWTTTQEYEKAIVITTTIGILGWIMTKAPTMLEWFYLGKLLKLDDAKKALEEEFHNQYKGIININGATDTTITTERMAQKAGISLWVARHAVRWEERRKRRI